MTAITYTRAVILDSSEEIVAVFYTDLTNGMEVKYSHHTCSNEDSSEINLVNPRLGKISRDKKHLKHLISKDFDGVRLATQVNGDGVYSHFAIL